MAGAVKLTIVIGLILLLLFLSGIVGFLIIQPPRQITSTLTETVRETLTLRSVDTVTITATRTITSTRTTTVTVEATLTKKEQAPPRIVNLSWEPARIVNDKIYDIRVRFLATSDVNPIVSAKLIFTPEDYRYFITRYGMRPQDYETVFPNDTRIIDLYPVDGVFNSTIEEFTTLIQNITGGVEYRIKVVVKDSAGREATTETKTPYIRQFENLGKELYEKGIIVGASYMSGYYPWQTGETPDDYPLLGRYNAIDEIVQWKHVDWAGYAGINVFFIGAGAWEDWKINGEEGGIMKGLMNKGIKCAFFWEPWGHYFDIGTNPNAPEWARDLTYPKNKENFVNQLSIILNSKLIEHPNYFKVDGKPVIRLYDAASFINERDAFIELRNNIKTDVIFFGDTTLKIPALPEDAKSWYFPLKDFSHYDWISTWVGFINAEVAKKYSTDYDEWYYRMTDEWSKWVRGIDKTYVSSIVPGFKYIWESEGIERRVDRIVNQLAYSLELTKLVTFDTWNDFAENTFIEPSQKEGFSCLDVIHRTFSEIF
jgi:hypothetical protein